MTANRMNLLAPGATTPTPGATSSPISHFKPTIIGYDRKKREEFSSQRDALNTHRQEVDRKGVRDDRWPVSRNTTTTRKHCGE
jgi:hypothetical protein